MRIILFYLTSLLFFVITGCSKENRVAANNSQTLPGSWELRASTGNKMPDRIYEPGNGNRFVFSGNQYTQLSPDVPTRNGTFTTTTAPNPNTGEETSAIQFEGNSLGTVCYSIEDNVLTFYWSALASCGSTSTYIRVADVDNTSGKP